MFFYKHCKREGPWRFREAKCEAKTRLFNFNVTMKIRESSVKDSVKGFREVLNLVPLADPSSAVHNFTNTVGIHVRHSEIMSSRLPSWALSRFPKKLSGIPWRIREASVKHLVTVLVISGPGAFLWESCLFKASTQVRCRNSIDVCNSFSDYVASKQGAQVKRELNRN